MVAVTSLKNKLRKAEQILDDYEAKVRQSQGTGTDSDDNFHPFDPVFCDAYIAMLGEDEDYADFPMLGRAWRPFRKVSDWAAERGILPPPNFLPGYSELARRIIYHRRRCVHGRYDDKRYIDEPQVCEFSRRLGYVEAMFATGKISTWWPCFLRPEIPDSVMAMYHADPRAYPHHSCESCGLEYPFPPGPPQKCCVCGNEGRIGSGFFDYGQQQRKYADTCPDIIKMEDGSLMWKPWYELEKEFAEEDEDNKE